MHTHRRIGDILVDLKALNRADVDRVVAALGRGRRQKFGQTARAMGLVREVEILAALAVQMRLMPGIEQLTLNEVLRQLQEAIPV